jgi:carboxylate-amine ligase
MAVRTFGIEEELLLVDPATRKVSSRSHEVLKEFHEHGPGRDRRYRATVATDELEQELFLHQVETRTDPTTDLSDALAQVVAARRTAGEAARAADLALIACGVVPMAGFEPVVTRNDRYQDMIGTFGAIARTGGTCGMHVHVGIDSDDEGVAVIDRIAHWLPVILAIGANSPYFEGSDTGYASWRAQVWSRWPSAGPTEPFGSVAGYREVSARLIELGAARDPGMLYFDARLSVDHPTVEIRVSDVCTDPAVSLLAAALVRGLVETAAVDAASGADPARWRVEMLRAAQWRASRYGVSDQLVHPLERTPRPAREVLQALVDHVRPALEETGDVDFVTEGVESVLRAGGAVRQRAAYERTGGVEGVVDDLVARTEETWAG